MAAATKDIMQPEHSNSNQQQKFRTGRVIKGNCVDIMRAEFADCSIPLTITSPPYDALDEDWKPVERTRDYDGYEFDFPEIAKELWRVTALGGVLVWIVGSKVMDGDEDATPEREMLYFRRLGFKRHDTIIYSKDGRYTSKDKDKNPIRYRRAWEYIYVFFKPATKGATRPTTMNLLQDHKAISFYVHKWRRNHASNRAQDGTLTQREYNVSPWSLRENIWYYQNGYFKSTLDKEAFGHGAVMPEKLAIDLIKSFSNKGDIVFDPMAGTGTVPKMAHWLGRKWVGCETSQKYIDITHKRLSKRIDPREYSDDAGTLMDYLTATEEQHK